MGSLPDGAPEGLPIRLAMIECDTPLPQTKDRYKGYGGVFEALLKAGAKVSGLLDPERDLHISNYNVETNPEHYPELHDIDAILITGSRHDSFADTPWINTLVEFTAEVLAQDRVKIIGVCFGHQIVARAMGVKLGRNPDGWEAAVNDVQLSEKGKQLFGKDKLSLHQMHRDIVFEYPPGVEELGYSPVCKVQGMYVQGRLITVQGHPEFTEPIVIEILDTRHAIGVFSDEMLAAAMQKVAKPHDGLVVSKAFLRFLLEG